MKKSLPPKSQHLVATLNFADLALGFTWASTSDASKYPILSHLCRSNFCKSVSSKYPPWNLALFTISVSSVTLSLKNCFTSLSSNEWKEIARHFPPGFKSLCASLNPKLSSLSSLLTKMRRAWNVFVATCECRWSLSFLWALQNTKECTCKT